MSAMEAVSLMGLAAAAVARALYVWLRGRATVQLARLNEDGLSRRVATLPPGSRLTEQRKESRVTVEVGMAPAAECERP